LEKERLSERKRLTEAENNDLERIKAVLQRVADEPTEMVDSLYVGTRDFFNANPGLLGKALLNHTDGRLQTKLFSTHTKKAAAAYNTNNTQEEDIVIISPVLGLLAIDNVEPPRVQATTGTPKLDNILIVSDPTDPAKDSFSKGFFAAFGETQGMFELAKLVLPILEEEGDPTKTRSQAGEVDVAEFANVMRCLKEKGITKGKGQLHRRVSECLDKIQKVGVDRPLSDIGIALPDLNEATDFEIQKENVQLIGVPICGAMFEELKVFQVVDKLVELSQTGMLPVSRGEAGEVLYKYWKDTPTRMSEAERRNFYALTIGVPGGDANGSANREFNDLWIRFVSSVSSLVRQMTADQLLRANIPAGTSQQQVRKAARDLAMNLS